ncbi:ABC transporter ATP-binding protein [Paenibacillus turpanensis]|uniref:ABC transporter ATP-binding protein n=1 Tax=Paenibacillus turpanensis TaxID=2689078 RepID=UPI00140C8FF9|nr:ATP-binding cassette domain-containing protein [Paenibacillus turpanensis]
MQKPQIVTAADQISFSLRSGMTMGLIGESGSGKSTVGELIVGLQQPDSGRICYKGKCVADMTKAERQQYRCEVQLIFQNPYDSLNPRMSILESVSEPMRIQGLFASKSETRQEALRLLSEVGLSEQYADRRPYELSGGQCQRVSIARSLGIRPKVLVCDEIVSALDVSVQTQVLLLLQRMKQTYGISYVFITHDLSVVRLIADELLVMSGGRIVEHGNTGTLFHDPQHPYTKQLMTSIPKPRYGYKETEPMAQQLAVYS